MTALPKTAASPLSFNEAWEIIGGLSNPSKMPWYGWSISAKACITGSKLRETPGSTCSKCYAHKGFYTMPKVKRALDRRLKALDHPQFVQAFALVLNTLYDKNGGKEDRFRWHDSGDLQNVEHLRKIVQICNLTPRIRHYLPTREPWIVAGFKRNGGVIPSNLFLKISHPMIGGTFDKPPMGLSYTTVGNDSDNQVFQCPALRYQGNKCRSCDRCWTSSNINYPLH